MAYIDIYGAATAADSTLKKQTSVAIAKAATDILNESDATENHNQRLSWARRAQADPIGWADKAIWKVLENATIQSAPEAATDSDVQFVVNSIIPWMMKGV